MLTGRREEMRKGSRHAPCQAHSARQAGGTASRGVPMYSVHIDCEKVKGAAMPTAARRTLGARRYTLGGRQDRPRPCRGTQFILVVFGVCAA